MCDAARVAREVVRDRNETPEAVLACIARGLGFTHISLSRQRVVQAGLPAVIRNLPAIIRALLVVLKELVAKHGWLLPVLKNLIEFLNEITKLIDKWQAEGLPDQIAIDELLDDGRCVCKDQPKLIGQTKK